jgi:hypothetical protein
MSTGSSNLGGRFFYQAKGLQGLLFKIPKETKVALRVLAQKLDRPLYGAVQLILDHYLDNPNLYDLNGSPAWGGDPVDVTAFVEPDVHKRMKLKGIHASRTLKDLTGCIIYQYITNHCQVNLGDENGDQ